MLKSSMMSILGPNTPPEIRKMAEKAMPGSSTRSYMFESWLTSSECWKSSKLLITLRSKSSTAKRGLRRWMTLAEMIERFGREVALEIKAHKESDERLSKNEIRKHPECPWREDCTSHDVVCKLILANAFIRVPPLASCPGHEAVPLPLRRDRRRCGCGGT